MEIEKHAQHVAKNSSSKNTTKNTAQKNATGTDNTEYVDKTITNAFHRGTSISKILPKVNTGTITGHFSNNVYLTSNGTGTLCSGVSSKPFTEFKKILRDFGINYKYSPKSNEDTWGIMVGEQVIYYNKRWYYFDGDKTKDQHEAIGHLLKSQGMELEESLWRIGK